MFSDRTMDSPLTTPTLGASVLTFRFPGVDEQSQNIIVAIADTPFTGPVAGDLLPLAASQTPDRTGGLRFSGHSGATRESILKRVPIV